MADITITEGDTLPAVRITCEDSEGTAVDIADAAVVLVVRNMRVGGFEEVEATNEQGVDEEDEDVITDQGIVSAIWDPPGEGGYHAWFQVTFDNNDVLTFPNGAPPISIDVHADPNPESS